MTTPEVSCAIKRQRIRMHSMTRGMLVGHRLELKLMGALTMATSLQTHCAVGSLLARGAGHALTVTGNAEAQRL